MIKQFLLNKPNNSLKLTFIKVVSKKDRYDSEAHFNIEINSIYTKSIYISFFEIDEIINFIDSNKYELEFLDNSIYLNKLSSVTLSLTCKNSLVTFDFKNNEIPLFANYFKDIKEDLLALYNYDHNLSDYERVVNLTNNINPKN